MPPDPTTADGIAADAAAPDPQAAAVLPDVPAAADASLAPVTDAGTPPSTATEPPEPPASPEPPVAPAPPVSPAPPVPPAPPAPSTPPAEDDAFHHPRIALAVGVLFVLAAGFKMQLIGGGSAWVGPADKLASGALMIATAVWFILCFTGNAKRRINDIFVFAYAFTLGSFAMLVLPFVSEQQSQADVARSATLSLVRGCVRKEASGGLGEVSAVVLCPYEVDKLKQWPDRHKADAASSAPVMEHHDGELRFTLLLAIGGVTATVLDDPRAGRTVAAAPASAASQASAPDKPPQHVEVVGGLAVPFFVLVLAFIGGAVSLSRRIPEYQRRLHPDYEAKTEETKMQAFQVRESVVFQIMQLVSAPFLALATWYIVTPTGLSSAATLAFGTGFASEPLLLMIRGVVQGIRPEGARPKPVAEPPAPSPPAPGPQS